MINEQGVTYHLTHYRSVPVKINTGVSQPKHLGCKISKIMLDNDRKTNGAWQHASGEVVMSYEFCSKFHTLFSIAKILNIGSNMTKLQRV